MVPAAGADTGRAHALFHSDARASFYAARHREGLVLYLVLP
jgi:hypothetical protein